MTLKTTVLPLLLCAIATQGCDKKKKPTKADREAAELAEAQKFKVELPASPNFDDGKTVEKYEDGAFSIYGIRRELDDNVKAGDAGTEIMIKGYVQDIYVPPECEEGEFCPPGKQPHVWISDKPEEKGKKRAMMVVNYRFKVPEWDAKRWKDAEEVILEKGKRYTFKGKFKRFSDTGFSHDRGLLEFVAYRPLDPETGAERPDWVHPPGASWHPLEVARQEQENAELAERAAKTAADYKNRGK